MKKCPACAEEIQPEALKCRFCGEQFGGPAPQEGMNWPGLCLATVGAILLGHSLLLETAVEGTSNLSLMHHRQMMLICALGLLILGALGWLFGKKTPVPAAPVYRSRVAVLSGSFLLLLAITTPSVNPQFIENTLLLAVLVLGYGFSAARFRRTLAVGLGTGAAAFLMQRSFDDARAHYVFAGLAAGFAAGLTTYGLGSRMTIPSKAEKDEP